MDLFSAEFWAALGSIIVIDLVLAGDNAIVIGMASRKLPSHQQKRAIVWGTVGAIGIRAAFTLVAVWLLKIPGLLLAGGVLLVWIAYNLLSDKKKHDNVKAGVTLGAAIRTIIIADAVMGIDNVLAVAGAAHGHFMLVVIGLLISVPIIVFGSTLILRLMERFPVIIYIGTGVLALTAGKMITEEPLIHGLFEAPVVKWSFIIALIAAVIWIGYRAKHKEHQAVA
ncbi:TerC family protein [Xylanibacillus composti]|uniref:Membrane protein n=1 Tax=Xylanibacillus composti TaxID=1572762 RepID=A0A8J4H440_9BACL|nr:TerC family protein [Xylanibacillus composti]MDT9724940.1 TerC family protein [Xylanibacillus composti]GIQ68178.1 membrane protein [Xylanibacillus composti]